MTRPAPGRRPVILSYGLGVDSTAILLRWLRDPESRDFDLEDLVVVIAQTGDEWPRTKQLVETHLFPLLRRHRIRVVQVARTHRTKTEAGGLHYAVISDTREPVTCHTEGLYRLSQEMFDGGTVPQTGGSRICSIHSKGEVIDWWVGGYTQGRPFTHVMGFELGELGRRDKDRLMGTVPGREPEYPLIEWGWFREDAIAYIRDHLGVTWEKSACTQCPFALDGPSKGETIARFIADPAVAMRPLLMEHVAVALNHKQGLIGGKRLVDELRRHPHAGDLLARFAARLDDVEWALYEVRRATVLGEKGKPLTSRSLTAALTGTRGDVRARLYELAAERGLTIERDGPHRRAWEHIRVAGAYPTYDHMWTIGPSTAELKTGPAFPKRWAEALAGPQGDAQGVALLL